MLLLAVALIAVAIRFAGNTGSAETSDLSSYDASTGATALECIMTRTSVRQYSDRAVSDTIIEKILRAGMAAPTAANCQPWEFVVITDQTLKDSITNSFQWTKMVKDAPFSVVVCGNTERFYEDDRRDIGFWVLDCSVASENMLLAANALGLGGVWCGIYPEKDREKEMTEILNLPSNLIPLNILAFGYPQTKPVPKKKWDPAKIHYNAF